MLLACAEHISRGSPDDYIPPAKNQGKQQSCSVKPRGGQPAGIYPFDKERILLAALRRGDNDTARKTLGALLEDIRRSTPGDFRFLQFRAIELVVLLSRAAVQPSSMNRSPQEVLETNNRYLERIQESRNADDLTDILHLIVERMAGQIFSFQGIRHASALRKAERYIWENYTRKISLREIAAASGLSAPYFSSIFKQEMGENLSSYLNRLRVGRAAAMLTESDLSLNEIAAACGFEDQSWFSKIFKNYTGLSPGKYRERGPCARDDPALVPRITGEGD
jgi:AraC-like DNA-binding protein